jgi:hypothetical protein
VQMLFIHRNRAEPALPQMPRHPHPCVDIAGIVPVDMAKRARQPILIARHGNDVNVVGHKAIGPDRDAMAGAGISLQIEIEHIIPILEEGPLAPVSPLRHMMRDIGNDHAGQARHDHHASAMRR